MIGWNHHCLVLLALLSLFSSATTLEINAVEFATRLKEICEDGLGQSKIQKLFSEKATFTTKVPTGDLGHDIVRKLAASVGKSFKNYSDAIWKLHRQFIAWPVNSTTPEGKVNVSECCKVKPGDGEAWCYRHHSGDAGQVAYPKEIVETMKEIAKDIPNIGWLYYGNEKGLLLQFPSQQAKSCTEYDHRLRFWYAEASAPVPKDIVIAIESIEGMTTSLLRNAVDTLLNSVNPNDRITVVKFGNTVSGNLGSSEYSTCFSQYLALGTPQNIRIFKEFVNSTEGKIKGPAELLPVITKGFEYFERADDATERGKLLVIFVASNPSDVKDPSEVIGRITAKNARLQRKVVIQTYAFGANPSNNTKDILQRLAESTHFETSSGRVKRGTFTHIEHGNQLRLQLHAYYSIFANSAEIIAPSVTVPYFDFFNLGLVVSFCLPINRGDKLEGVTCVDAKLEDIFFNVTYYHQGIDAYGFIIDNRGRTMLHPLLPKPTEVSEDTKFINILSLERDQGVQEIIESMKSGGNGSRRLHASKIKARLGLDADFPGSQNLVSEYYWTKVPDTDYSLCMVFTDRDREVEMEPRFDQQDSGMTNYIHPYTLIHGEKDLHIKCRHDEQGATTDGSVVMFSGSAYRFLFVGVNFNDSTQRRSYNNFFKGQAYDQAPEFKETTREWVTLSGQVDTIWMDAPSRNYDLYIVWRHLVTASGVIRIYPGVNYTQYNPNSFSWYKQAILSEDRIHLYPAKRRNSFNVMISQAIQESRPDTVPVAVVGGEIRPTILYNILVDVYPACKAARCFIVDGNGYVLAHKRYGNKEVLPSHISAMEPAIAHYLIDNGHLVEAKCLNFLSQYRTLSNWKMAIKGWYVSSRSPQFELQAIHGTNVFVVITWHNDANSCNCKNLTKCMQTNQHICRCPCFETLKFNLCNNTLPQRGNNGYSACSILRNNFDVIHTDSAISHLKPCFKSPCDAIRSEMSCPERNGCQWCMLDGEKEPSCHDRLYCGPAGPMTENTGVHVAVPIILSLLILILIIVLCCIIRYFPVFRQKLFGKKHQGRDQEIATPSGRISPIYNEANSIGVLGDNSYIGLNDSGMASEAPTVKSDRSLVTILKPETDTTPPLPKRSPLHSDSTPTFHDTGQVIQGHHTLSNQSGHPQSIIPIQPGYLTVYAQSQMGQRSLHESYGTPKVPTSVEDSTEKVYVNEEADLKCFPYKGESLSLDLGLFNSDRESITDHNNESDDAHLNDSQGNSTMSANIIGNNSSTVTSKDSGMMSEVSRQGNSQTYLKTPGV